MTHHPDFVILIDGSFGSIYGCIMMPEDEDFGMYMKYNEVIPGFALAIDLTYL